MNQTKEEQRAVETTSSKQGDNTMTRRRMENLYKELEAVGINFFECEGSIMNKCQGGKDDVISVGILKDARGSVITEARLKKILAIAKKKKTYVLIRPEKGELRVNGSRRETSAPLTANEMVVCFIQIGVIDTFKGAYAKVDAILKQHFLHFQEDEEILELETALNILFSRMREFEFLAYDLVVWRTHSLALNRSFKGYSSVFTRMNEMLDYMNGPLEKQHAATLCFAGQCLRLICE